MTVKAPGPGVYQNVPADDYHAWPYASNSRLSKLVPPSTPAHLRVYLDMPAKGTKAMREGRILHACALEPDIYASDYRLAGQCIATTGKGAQCSKDGTWPISDGIGSVCTTHLDTAIRNDKPFDIDEDVVVVSEKDDRMARAVRDAVAAHPKAGAFLRAPDGQTEVSIVWDDPETGVRCKARWDFYSESLAGGTIMDLKGARDASPYHFGRDAFKLGYFRQATLYLWAAKTLELPAAHFSIVACEKVPPWQIAVYKVDETILGGLPGPGEQAYHCAANLRALLRLWDRCQQSGHYPGYSESVQDLSLEEWQWSAMDEQTADLRGQTAAPQESAA